jgi:glycosyltransferase involved in cell wall biosynthesis
MKVCALIPTYDNPDTIARVVDQVRRHLADVLVVDDGSAPPARRVIADLAASGACSLLVRPANGGKGAAMKDGFAWAREHGFDYVLAIDADLQHEAADIPRLVAAIDPERPTLVLGKPIFDASAPALRMVARQISVFWVMVETLGRKIGDPLCGFRVYPVGASLATRTRADAMDFDAEIAVRLVWAGVAVAHVPTRVVYPPGSVSHYRLVTDTVLLALLYVRLFFEGSARLILRAVRALFGKGRSSHG